jgi:hypothetical protein
MKFIKYLLIVFPLAALIASCDDHELGYADSDVVGVNDALFQISYFAPKAANASNGLDSIYVNGKKFGGVGGCGQLLPNGCLPYSGTGMNFWSAPSGPVHLTIYKADEVVYDRDIVLEKGRQRVYLYNLDSDPIIITDPYPYVRHEAGDTPTVETFDTDTVMLLRMINFFWEDADTPYAGKLQYQWSNNSGTSYTAGDWHNLGEPVGFGEATDYCPVIIHKTTYNSAGNQTIRYRCVDAEGNTVTRTTDYWSGYIGRVVNHVLRGCKTGAPAAGYTQLNMHSAR